MTSANYYAIIPATVRYDTSLPANAKLMYGEITALANADGYCWANNSYFAKLYDVSDRTVTRWIELLCKKGYLQREVIRSETNAVTGRALYISDTPMVADPPDKNVTPSRHMGATSRQNCPDPPDKNVEYYNRKNNTRENRESARAKKSYGEFLNVYLSDEECKKLAERFHPQDVQAAVDRLSCYIEQTGKKYKSHYATLLNWLRKDVGDNGSQLVPTVALAERGGVDEWQ